MTGSLSLGELTEDLPEAIPAIDSETTGQYGDGLGSEDEERQLKLLVKHLCEMDERYGRLKREVGYPDRSGRCDLVLPSGMPVEAKLIRYWRANGDPEPTMYSHVFSPFHQNTLLTDARRLHESTIADRSGLLGLFYTRADEDSKAVSELPERYTATDIAEKIVRDIDYWYGVNASVCNISRFGGLQHTVHKQGAVLSFMLQ
ncbi:MAG: hypothetical protein ABEJ40_11745 [Haloarculaceae archaeon]